MKICDLKIRIPEPLKALLQERANSNDRTMNGEILHLLKAILTNEHVTHG